MVVLKVHRRNDVYVGELRESGTSMESPKRLTVSESRDLPSGWTGDSKAVLFESNRTGRYQIFKQGLGQETTEPLIQGPDIENGAQMSPDGAWILYWSSQDDHGGSPATTARLMRVPANGGSPEQILDVPSESDTDFECSSHPAGSCVLSRWEQSQLIFYALDPVLGRGKELGRTKLNLPSHVSLSVSPDGSRIAVASEDQLPEQIRILDLRKSTERTLSCREDQGISGTSPGPPMGLPCLRRCRRRITLFCASSWTAKPTHCLAAAGISGSITLARPRMVIIWRSASRPSRAMRGCWQTSNSADEERQLSPRLHSS